MLPPLLLRGDHFAAADVFERGYGLIKQVPSLSSAFWLEGEYQTLQGTIEYADEYYACAFIGSTLIEGKSSNAPIDLAGIQAITVENAADKSGTNLTLEVSGSSFSDSASFQLHVYPVLKLKIDDYISMEVTDVVPVHISFPAGQKNALVTGSLC